MTEKSSQIQNIASSDFKIYSFLHEGSDSLYVHEQENSAKCRENLKGFFSPFS